MANRIRVWPYSETRVTEKIEITAPAARMVPGTAEPVMFSMITESPAFCCSSLENSSSGWDPTPAIATRT